jgi:predicted membrane-bound mannosyltransferase
MAESNTKGRRTVAIALVVVLFVLPVVYVFFYGPAMYLYFEGTLPQPIAEVLIKAYRPLMWTADQSQMCEKMLGWYADLWLSLRE